MSFDYKKVEENINAHIDKIGKQLESCEISVMEDALWARHIAYLNEALEILLFRHEVQEHMENIKRKREEKLEEEILPDPED